MTDSERPREGLRALPSKGSRTIEDRVGSAKFGSAPWSVNDALSQVRQYRDGAALDRAWNRLEGRRRRSLNSSPLTRSMAAAALVAAGVLLGIVYERQRIEQHHSASVSSEVIEAHVPAAAAFNRSRDATTEQRPKKESSSKGTRRRGVAADRTLLTKSRQAAEGDPTELKEETQAEVVEVVPPPSKAAWLLSAERGDFAAAFQELDKSGGFDAVLAHGSSEELMTLVEVARFVGRNGRAIQALRAVTTRYQGDPNAPLAAMILGNLLSRTGDAPGAAEAYALNRRLSPGGDFAEDALVREFDMAVADGDLASVERLQAQYEAEFPEGRHGEEIRAEAARLLDLAGISSMDASRASGDASRASSVHPDKNAERGRRDGQQQSTVRKDNGGSPKQKAAAPVESTHDAADSEESPEESDASE